MPHLTKSIAAATVAAELVALLTPLDVTAQERITLETIGAVRMARFEEVRPANPELRPAQTAPARDRAAARTAKAH